MYGGCDLCADQWRSKRGIGAGKFPGELLQTIECIEVTEELNRQALAINDGADITIVQNWMASVKK